jgi:hypothetical protein
MDERGREWRVMRFENSEGKYAEVGTYLGANTIPVPPGYKLVSSTPMVPASRLAGAVAVLEQIVERPYGDGTNPTQKAREYLGDQS